jgi:hypothetical protein
MNKDALSIGLTIIIQAVKNYDTYGLPENGLLPVFQKEQSLEKSAEKLAVG